MTECGRLKDLFLNILWLNSIFNKCFRRAGSENRNENSERQKQRVRIIRGCLMLGQVGAFVGCGGSGWVG